MSDFDRLLDDAVVAAREFSGWDFSAFAARIVVEGEPWDYTALVSQAADGASSMLDLGTGGGEFLAGLPSRPPITIATEGWAPNVPVAKRNLAPLGVHVVTAESARDNVLHTPDEHLGRLPFADGSLDLVVSRHEAFLATEVARVLRPGGVFVTQQVGSDNEIELNRALGEALPHPGPGAEEYAAQLSSGGLDVLEAREARPAKTYLDVGVAAFCLLVFPGQVPGFDVDTHRDALAAIHEAIERDGGFTVREHRLLLRARRP